MTNLQGRLGVYSNDFRDTSGAPQGLRMHLLRANPSRVDLHGTSTVGGTLAPGSSRKEEDYIATFDFQNTPGDVGIQKDTPYIFRIGSTGGVPVYGQNLYLEVIQMSDDGNYNNGTSGQFDDVNVTVTLRFRRLPTRRVQA